MQKSLLFSIFCVQEQADFMTKLGFVKSKWFD